MHPSDWLSIYYILVLKGHSTMIKIINHFQLMIQSYMYDIEKFDIEISKIVNLKPNLVEVGYEDHRINPGNLFSMNHGGHDASKKGKRHSSPTDV